MEKKLIWLDDQQGIFGRVEHFKTKENFVNHVHAELDGNYSIQKVEQETVYETVYRALEDGKLSKAPLHSKEIEIFIAYVSS